MGVFTVYCCVCGGPSMDLTSWVQDREEDDFPAKFGAGDLTWLEECLVVTPLGLLEGSCDCYGRVSTPRGTVCVLKMNWSAFVVRKRKPWEEDDEEEGEIPGVLLHKVCAHMVPPLFVVPDGKLFRAMGNLLEHDMSQVIDGVDYGDAILANQGQDYELNVGEGHLVTNPTPLFVVRNIHANRPARIDGAFSNVPIDIVTHKILPYLTPEEVLLFGQTCKSSYSVSRVESYWLKHAPSQVTIDATVYGFSCNAARDNFVRIRQCASQLAAQVASLSPTPQPKPQQGDWGKWKVADLKSVLRERGLPVSGVKDVLIDRIEQDDARKKQKTTE